MKHKVRALATSANEENMLKTFREGGDIHTENARVIFGKQDVTEYERRFAKTGTFSVLYGAEVESIADNYFDGDIRAAQEFLDKFNNGFPSIKGWQDKLKAEVQVTGKVPLMTNRFISIPVPSENQDPAGFASAMRKAGNYPIQGASSDVAGCTAFEIDDYSTKNNLKLSLFLFIHDSIESDCPPQELLQQFASQTELLARYPEEEFSMYCKADLSCGASLGHECEIDIHKINDSYDEAVFSISGYRDEVEDTINLWKNAYHSVELLTTKWKDQFVDMNDFFIPKKAMSPYFLKTRQKGSAVVHLKYYDKEDTLAVSTNDEGKLEVTVV